MQTFTHDSKSSPGQTYRTIVHGGEAVCNCPGYTNHGRCWHVDQALKEEKMPEETREVAIRDAAEETAPPKPLALSIPPRSLPTTDELAVMSQIARTLAGARGHSVPKEIDTPAKAAAIVLAGWELGIKPMTAFRHVFVVNGRTEIDSQVMMGLVRAKDPTAEFVFHEYSGERCEVELFRNGRSVVKVDYTKADAVASGQMAKGGPWKQYTRDMLAWAATKRVCRLGAPDIINAIASIDEGDAADMVLAGGESPGEDAALLEAAEREEAAAEQEARHASESEPEREAPPEEDLEGIDGMTAEQAAEEARSQQEYEEQQRMKV